MYIEIVGFPGSGKTHYVNKVLKKIQLIESSNKLLRISVKLISVMYAFLIFDAYARSCLLSRWSIIIKINLIAHIGFYRLMSTVTRREVYTDQGIIQLLITLKMRGFDFYKSFEPMYFDNLRLKCLQKPFEQCLINVQGRAEKGTSYNMTLLEYQKYYNAMFEVLDYLNIKRIKDENK